LALEMLSTLATEILIIVLLVLLNGVFAMSEIAVVSARKARLQQLAREGKAGARAALALAAEPTRFLSTVQIGITLVGILAGAFGGATLAEQLADRLSAIPGLARYSEAIGVAIIVVAISYLSLVVGELVPKRLALTNPEKVASAVARPMRTLATLAAPVVQLLSLSTNAILRVLVPRPPAEQPVTEEEIKILIEQGAQSGVFEAVEQEIVESVFRLADRRVGALMTPRTEIVWLDLNDAPEEIERQVAACEHSRFPVGQGRLDNVVGIVRGRDVLATRASGQPFDLKTIMTLPLFVPESLRALTLLE
jgi:putative hemolysin